DQRDASLGRKTLARLDHEHAVRAGALAVARLEDRFPRGIRQDAETDRVWQSVHPEARVPLDGRGRGGSVELEDEGLVLVDRVIAVARLGGLNGRTSRAEGELCGAAHRTTIEARQSRTQREATADAGGEIAREIVDPDAGVHP